MTRRVAYLGPPGTYSETAALAYDPGAELIPCPSFTAAVLRVEAGAADAAVVAIENSLEGSVTETLDLLVHGTELSITGELVIPIAHCLLAKPGTALSDIEVVFSHTQALGQCRNFIERQLGGASKNASLSTVAAVTDMLDSERVGAAISPRRAADLYPVEIIAETIQDRAENATRFVALAGEDHAPTGHDKTSIAFNLRRRGQAGAVLPRARRIRQAADQPQQDRVPALEGEPGALRLPRRPRRPSKRPPRSPTRSTPSAPRRTLSTSLGRTPRRVRPASEAGA